MPWSTRWPPPHDARRSASSEEACTDPGATSRGPLLAAAGAMSHAETTFAAALPWGALEAAAVVAGFTVLGPQLGLRSPEPPKTPTVSSTGGE